MPTRNTGLYTDPKVMRVESSLTTMPPLIRPSSAMKMPRPTAMAWRRETGTASIMASRKPHRTNARMIRPSRKMTAMATFQSPPAAAVSENATTALMPMPDAQASGRFANRPMRMVMMPAAKQVEVTAAPTGMPAADRSAGLTAMM